MIPIVVRRVCFSTLTVSIVNDLLIASIYCFSSFLQEESLLNDDAVSVGSAAALSTGPSPNNPDLNSDDDDSHAHRPASSASASFLSLSFLSQLSRTVQRVIANVHSLLNPPVVFQRKTITVHRNEVHARAADGSKSVRGEERGKREKRQQEKVSVNSKESRRNKAVARVVILKSRRRREKESQ